jgi:hypothetical protein
MTPSIETVILFHKAGGALKLKINDIMGVSKAVVNDTTATLLKRVAASFICSLCTRFDMFLSGVLGLEGKPEQRR